MAKWNEHDPFGSILEVSQDESMQEIDHLLTPKHACDTNGNQWRVQFTGQPVQAMTRNQISDNLSFSVI